MTTRRTMIMTAYWASLPVLPGRCSAISSETTRRRRRSNEIRTTPIRTDIGTLLNDIRDQRLTAMEAKVTALDQEEDTEGEEEGAPPDPELEAIRDLEGAKEETIQQWNDRIEAHEQEPIDYAWSEATTKLFQDDVQKLAAAHVFQMVDAKCKSTTCSVTVQWNDYGAALQNYSGLLHNDYQKPCFREVLLPEPASRDQPYQATVIYDCKDQRSGT